MWIRPSDDASRELVRCHQTLRAVPPEGMEVPDYDQYWLRRLAQGDVVRGEVPAEAAPANPEETTDEQPSPVAPAPEAGAEPETPPLLRMPDPAESDEHDQEHQQ